VHLFRNKPIRPVVPVEFEVADEWMNADAKRLHAFLTCPTGIKLRQRIVVDLVEVVQGHGQPKAGKFHSGRIQGRRELFGELLGLQELDPDEEE